MDLEVIPSLELPLVWLTGFLQFSIWQQRQNGRVCPAKTRSELEAVCRIMREGKSPLLQNAFTQTMSEVAAMFA